MAQTGVACAKLLGRLSFEHKQALSLARDELANDLMARSQKRCDQSRRTIAHSQPNELGRRAEHNGLVIEVRILGEDRETVLFRPGPNDAIIGFLEADSLDVRGIRK
jgi:hypothetical protein